MALTKVSTAMFDTAAQSSDLNIDANTLFVDVSTNRVGIGTTSPSVPLEVSGQLKAGGITYPTSDGSNGQALVTNGSGVASFATVAPTAGTGVSVSGTTVSIGQAVGTSSNVTFNNLVVAGTLTVNGATNTNSATNTTIEDILIELGTGTSGSPANDAGLVLERGSSDNVFIGWDESADTFTVGTGSFTGASSGNLTITPATAVFGGLTVDTSTLVVDASNNRVGIGNASPDVSLDIGSFTDAVHVPVGTTAQRPTGAAGYFRYNSTLNKFEGYTTSWGEIGGGGSNTFTTNVYTGDGSTTAFTLSQSVDSVNNLIVFIDGVYQVPTAAYTVSGTTLTMTAAPANTRKIVAYSVQSAISGTNLNQNSFTGNGSAVAFTLSIAPVNENNTQVFLDGVYQHKSTYATSGTTLTFDTAPASGVAIEVMIFTQTEINVPVDGTITTAKLAAEAVTSAKIADDAVGADQLASNAVVTASIVNDAVTSAKIADDAVGNDQLASGLTLGGNTTATIATAAQPNITSVGTLTALTVGGTLNVTGDGDDIIVSSADHELVLIGNRGSSGANLDKAYIRMKSESTNTVVIDTAGVSYFNGGNVGIGDSTPQALLDVGGGYGGNTSVATFAHATDAYIEIENMTTQNGAGIILTNAGSKKWTIQKDTSAHGLYIQDASTNANMTFLQGGNVGIGETSPGALLHVKHSGGGFDEVARLTSVANSAGDGAFLGFHGNSTSKFYGFIGGYDIAYNKGGIKIGVGNGETAIHDDMTALTIDNDGGVTMTRADNGAVLTLKSTDNDADRGPVMDFFRDASDGVNANNDKIGAIRFLGNDTVGQSNVYFIMEAIINQADNGAEDGYLDISGLHNGAKTRCMIIGGSGGSKVYIGTSVNDMYGYLNVQGDNGLSVGYANDQGDYRRLYATGTTTSTTAIHLTFWNGLTSPQLTYNGVWTDSSDVSLKKDIVDIEYGLETVKKLKPRKYKMKSNDEEQVGFIAQEVESEVPEVVTQSTTPDGDEQKGLAYGHLVAVLTKAIQEQQELIETLQTKVAALENN